LGGFYRKTTKTLCTLLLVSYQLFRESRFRVQV
jgi:hypothetical protein